MRNFGGRIVRFCPHFSVDEVAACSASGGEQYSPSELQQKEYCTADSFTFCPFFRRNAPETSIAAGSSARSDR